MTRRLDGSLQATPATPQDRRDSARWLLASSTMLRAGVDRNGERSFGAGTSACVDPPKDTRPAAAVRPLLRTLLLLGLTLALSACGSWPGMRRSAGTASLGDRNREDPALSGQGRILASVMPRGGRPSVVLQEQPSGRLLPMGPLNRWTPHRSPSLSRNGRYLALVVQQGERSLPVVWDRASGQLHRLPLPPGQEAVRLSLSPEGRTLAIEIWREGRSNLRVFDLSGLLEPDLPGGLRVQGGGPPPRTP